MTKNKNSPYFEPISNLHYYIVYHPAFIAKYQPDNTDKYLTGLLRRVSLNA